MNDVSIEKFHELIQAFEKARLKYVVVGGFAVDGRRRKLSRAHHDIDMMCQKEDEESIERLIKSLHYTLVERFDEMYKLKSVDGTKVDLFLVSFDEEHAHSRGKVLTYSFPKELFMHDLQKGIIDGFIFTIPCDSFIKKAGIDAKAESDQDFVKTLVGDDKKSGLIRKILHYHA